MPTLPRLTPPPFAEGSGASPETNDGSRGVHAELQGVVFIPLTPENGDGSESKAEVGVTDGKERSKERVGAVLIYHDTGTSDSFHVPGLNPSPFQLAASTTRFQLLSSISSYLIYLILYLVILRWNQHR